MRLFYWCSGTTRGARGAGLKHRKLVLKAKRPKASSQRPKANGQGLTADIREFSLVLCIVFHLWCFQEHDEIVHEIVVADIEIFNFFDGKSIFEIEVDGTIVFTIYGKAYREYRS
jgi:hypothetical protein